jgi:selenocysteine lyase/cysteine desulfurase
VIRRVTEGYLPKAPPETDATDAALRGWRADTPGCSERIHLNNAGAALMPASVLGAIVEQLELESRIGGYEAADARASQISETYRRLGALLNASPANIAVVPSATSGFVRAVSSFDFVPGDVIVTSRCDYTSNQIQYLALSKRLGVEILYANDLPEGGVDPASVRELASHPRCRLVSVSWIPTNSGLIQDVAAVGDVCEKIGVPFLIDACQAIGQIEIDVTRLKCDYLSATARKFLRGPRGMGFMYASDRALARGDHPLFVDMRGARWTDLRSYEIEKSAKRYEEWELPYALVLGMSEAARYALNVGVETASARAFGLAAELRGELERIPRVRVLDEGSRVCAIVTATIEGWNASEVVKALAARRINAVATLREYAIMDFDQKQVTSAIRLSPHYYNTSDEINSAVDCIREITSLTN